MFMLTGKPKKAILCQVFLYKNKGASTIENAYSYNMEVSRVELYIT